MKNLKRNICRLGVQERKKRKKINLHNKNSDTIKIFLYLKLHFKRVLIPVMIRYNY